MNTRRVLCVAFVVVSACVQGEVEDEHDSRSALAVDEREDVADAALDSTTASETPELSEHASEISTVSEDSAEQRAARASLEARLENLVRRSGQPFPEAWASATEAEMHDVAQLTREVSPARAFDHWEEHLSAQVTADRTLGSVAPTSAQVEALREIAERSTGMLDVQWDFPRGTPSRLEQTGFVLRGREPLDVWKAFLLSNEVALTALFGRALLEDAEHVRIDHAGPFDIVRFVRRRRNLLIAHDYVDAYVTNASSPLGAGVLWRIRSRWNPLTPLALDRLLTRDLISESEARHLAGGSAMDMRLMVSCSQECSARWKVVTSADDAVILDAVTGEIVGHYAPFDRSSGAVQQLGFPPTSGPSGTPIRFRGARITNSANVDIGFTSQLSGTYNIAAPDPWKIDITGGRSTSGGAWLDGRVEFVNGSWGPPSLFPVSWTPSTSPNRNFGSPDAWPSQTTTLRHGASITYGWLAYWQSLFKNTLSVEVPATMSFSLGSNPDGTCIEGGQTGVGDTGAPASGQSTRGYASLGWYASDGNPPNFLCHMAGVAHEYGHALSGCIANPMGCAHDDPDNGDRPADPEDWREAIWQAYNENFPSMLGTLLTEFRTGFNGGSYQFEPTWHYGGYFDTTDDFGNIAEDSANLTDCPTHACPSGYVCSLDNPGSPYGNGPGFGVCSRSCSGSPACMNSRPYCVGGHCDGNSYTNQWFTNVGTRLAFDVGWMTGLRLMLLAAANVNDNGTREFNIGTDTWYDALTDQGLNVAAVTRAVRSVTTQPGVTSRDDFADSRAEALPIPVWNVAGTYLNWGSGAGLYPALDSNTDIDYFAFRGLANSSYTVTADPRPGSSVDLSVSIYRLSDGVAVATGSNPTGPTAALTTGGLPSTDWYGVRISNRVPSNGAYTAYVKLASTTSDDFAQVATDAYPLPSGVTQSGYLGSLDVDRFQIYVPTTTGSLNVGASSAVGTPIPMIQVFSPSGTSLGSAAGTLTISAATIAANGTGYYLVDIRDAASFPRAYSVTATLSCASSGVSSCDNLSAGPILPARYAWGDRFAGRLPTATTTATYSVGMFAYESASIGLVSDNASCRFAIDLYPPEELDYFRHNTTYNPVFSWTDDNNSGVGTGATDVAGSRRGAGGHFYAPTAGTYKLVVRQTAGGTCAYRLNVVRSGHTTNAWPQW